MKRIAVGTTLLMLVLAAPALAATKSAGVAFVKATQSADPDDGDPVGEAAYNGATGPASGNVLTVVVTGNQLAFTAPLTVILPSPFAGDQFGNCRYGLGKIGQATCTIPDTGLDGGYPSGCSLQVTGNAGAEDITLRRHYVYNPYQIPDDCWYMFINVVTKDGNDKVNAHDDNPTHVVCGAGYDSVFADSWDDVSGDCEAVGRV
jgi:hypothetical protein